ncbi:MAG: lysophospholipid acyltransferase family protein [Deltaproteobacteria bacterium]|nr:lysophospholipid acyltransferase family protein [Deltaproteobacteria bacterium]
MTLSLSSFLQWRFNILMCKTLGLRVTFYYISILGKLYFFFNKKETWQIKKAVNTVFSDHKHRFGIRSLTKNVFRGIVFHYYEKFVNAFAPPEALKTFLNIHVEGEGMTALDKALAKENGVLLITGHYGGLEFIPAFLGANNYPVTIVARFSSDSLRKLCFHQADNFSVKVIDGDHTPNIAKAIFSDLRENRIVITQCDEIDEWRPCRHQKIHFLGQEIHLDKTINLLSKRCGAAVVFGVMHRNQQHRYKFIVTSWEEMAKRFQRTGDMSIGAVVLKFMENYIYKHPEGWYQWKNYKELDLFAPSGADAKAPASIPVLEPSTA